MGSNDFNHGETRHILVGAAEHWQAQRDVQLRFLVARGLRPTHHLLDIGCGTLRGGIPLIRFLEPGHYYGIEVRRDVLEQGREELREQQLEQKVPVLRLTATLAGVTFPQRFDFIWAFAVLIHMSDGIADDCLGLVARALAPQGRFYATVNVSVRAEGKWHGFPVVARTVAFYEHLARAHQLAVTDMGSMRSIRREIDGAGADTTRMLEFSHGDQRVAPSA